MGEMVTCYYNDYYIDYCKYQHYGDYCYYDDYYYIDYCY